jgi:hypothetical protein
VDELRDVRASVFARGARAALAFDSSAPAWALFTCAIGEMLMPNEVNELKQRVEAKKKELEAQIAKFKADSLGQANDKLDALQSKLNSLESDLKSGWENVSDAVAGKLNRWLSDKD